MFMSEKTTADEIDVGSKRIAAEIDGDLSNNLIVYAKEETEGNISSALRKILREFFAMKKRG